MWLEQINEPADQVPEASDGSLADFSEHGFKPRERLLDWIEVGTVGRQKYQRFAFRRLPIRHDRRTRAGGEWRAPIDTSRDREAASLAPLRLPTDRRRATSPPKPLPRSGFELCQKSDVEIQFDPS